MGVLKFLRKLKAKPVRENIILSLKLDGAVLISYYIDPQKVKM